MNKLIVLAAFLAVVSGCNCSSGPCNPALPAGTHGSCPQPGIADGQLGGHCRGFDLFNPPCDGTSWIQCDNGTCAHCGDPNGYCCFPNGSCQGNNVCDSAPGTSFFCATTCGQTGQPCCLNNNCATGLACNVGTGRCGTGSGDPHCTGPTTYSVGLVNAYSRCGDGYYMQPSDSQADAIACVNARLLSSGSIDTTAPAGETSQLYPFCVGSAFGTPMTQEQPAFSQEDANQCAHWRCMNCDIDAGACPP